MGYEIEEICKCGILAKIGKVGKTLLIRADMDALPMVETNDLLLNPKMTMDILVDMILISLCYWEQLNY